MADLSEERMREILAEEYTREGYHELSRIARYAQPISSAAPAFAAMKRALSEASQLPKQSETDQSFGVEPRSSRLAREVSEHLPDGVIETPPLQEGGTAADSLRRIAAALEDHEFADRIALAIEHGIWSATRNK